VISAPAPTGLDKAAPIKRSEAMKETLAKEFPTPAGSPRRLCADSGHCGNRDRTGRHLTGIVAAQGALPIKVGDEVIGAAGVSGAPGGEKDEACVKAGLDKVADQLK
jgi:hypothetical protein